MQALQHTTVGYKLSATQIGLLSHYNPLYMDSFQQKQAILRLFEPYWTILLMIDTSFLVV